MFFLLFFQSLFISLGKRNEIWMQKYRLYAKTKNNGDNRIEKKQKTLEVKTINFLYFIFEEKKIPTLNTFLKLVVSGHYTDTHISEKRQG